MSSMSPQYTYLGTYTEYIQNNMSQETDFSERMHSFGEMAVHEDSPG